MAARGQRPEHSGPPELVRPVFRGHPSPLLGPPRLDFFLDSPPFFFSRPCSFTTRMKPGNTCASKWSLDVARRRGSGTGKLPWLRRLLGKHAEFGGGGRKRPELIPLLTLEESILNFRMGLSNLSIRMGGITPTFSHTTAYFKHVIKQVGRSGDV